MPKLFLWSVSHNVRNRNGMLVKRLEKGIIRAENSEEARAALEKSVCTIFSKDLVVVEIPEKMTIYSIAYTDTIASG